MSPIHLSCSPTPILPNPHLPLPTHQLSPKPAHTGDGRRTSPPAAAMPPPLQAHRLLISHRRLPIPARRRFTAVSSVQSAPATTLAPGPATSSILSIRESLLSGERTAADITSEYLSRLRRTEPSLRSFIHVADAAAEREAEELDRRIASGEKDAVGPLAGVLVGVKDNFCTANMPSTGGSRILDGYRPAYDATAVRRLREAGAIVVGKTNLDEFGMGSTTEGSAFQVGGPDPHIV